MGRIPCISPSSRAHKITYSTPPGHWAHQESELYYNGLKHEDVVNHKTLDNSIHGISTFRLKYPP